MMSFLKTFGKGILYFIGLPFLIVFLVLYGIYLFGIFLYYFLKMIIYFFKGKKFNLKDEMDDKALYILKQRKAEAINKDLNPTPTNITNNFTNINVDPNMLNTLKNNQIDKELIEEKETPLIDVTKDNEDLKSWCFY